MPSTPNTDLSFYIHKLSNHTDRISHAIYDRRALSDCSLTSLFVLDFLYEHPDQPICQRDIEDEFFINRATASKMLRLMEDKQLIRRTVSGQDRRLKTIELLDTRSRVPAQVRPHPRGHRDPTGSRPVPAGGQTVQVPVLQTARAPRMRRAAAANRLLAYDFPKIYPKGEKPYESK